jgi:dipeptidase E
MDGIINRLRPEFQKIGIESVDSPHYHPNNEIQVIRNAEAIFIGGGNTGILVANLHALRNQNGVLLDDRINSSKNSLIDELRVKVADGIPVIGSSAGLNVMCKDVRTTNDMQPVVSELPDKGLYLRIDALGLLPQNLSINPHYLDQITVTEDERTAILAINPKLQPLVDHQGEPRIDRLSQILQMDRSRNVLALREGSFIRVQGPKMEIKGTTGGIIFQSGHNPLAVNNGDRLDFLLK